jgi:putative Mg2+ transporter-C (MgtC) family protein
MGDYIDYNLSIDFLIKVLAALTCGGVLGLERQLQGKHPGLKTNMLICLGCMAFTHLAQALVDVARAGDPTRVLGQVITGIGFLAAGSIFFQGNVRVGLTTSAVVLVNAGIGSCIGYGRLSEAVVLTLVTVFFIPLVRYVEFRYRNVISPDKEENPYDT